VTVLERVTYYFLGILLNSVIFCQVAISSLTTSALTTPLYLASLYQSSSSP